MSNLYDKLAHKLQTQAITRGPNKGRAPAQKQWAVSGHNSYLEWDGDAIVGNYEQTQVLRVTKEGTISINTRGWYDRPTTRDYIWQVAGINLSSCKFKGRSHTVVTIADNRKVLFYDGMVLDKYRNLLTPPKEFIGSRVDKKESADLRANFKLLYDALPMYHLAHNGVPSGRPPHPIQSWKSYQPWQVEEQLEMLLDFVLSENHRGVWMPNGTTEYKYGTLAQCKQWLNRQLTEYEDYNTGLYYID